MIDFHNHLLPAVDDGSADLAQSRAAVENMRASGVRTIVVTPHLQSSVTERPQALTEALAAIDRGYEEFTRMAAGEFPEIRIDRGVELMLDSPAPDLMDPRLRLAGTNFVLVEFPSMAVPPHSVQALYRLRLRGYWPIVAHPERYRNLESMEVVEEWRSVGAHLQVNAGSTIGRYGKRAEELAWELLGNGSVDYLCSDYHARGRPAFDECRAAFLASGGQECFHRLTVENSGRMLQGEEPLPTPPLQRRRSLWRFMRRGRFT
jgi:protein-tyrosine phosphatase